MEAYGEGGFAMSVIQFESVVENNIIRIPEEYLEVVSPGTKVTVRSDDNPTHSANRRAEAGALLPDDFTVLKIDTRGFKFDREEANERR
jgi:hypothetical protein